MKNQILWQQALEHIPGGVNSPVRAFNAVGGTPRFICRGEGARLFDEDNNAYIDYMGSWGPLIVGHAHPQVVQALCDSAQRGLSFGAPTAIEVEFAQTLKKMLPILEKVRLVSSGTEATMSAIRVARGFTGRNAFVKFIGCYHGHSDSLLVQAGSGALTFGSPSSSGVPTDTVKNTYTLAYNDSESLKKLFTEQGNNIAAVIVEPIAGNMGMVMPDAIFLETLQTVCKDHNSLLIADEVMTGFRVGLTGATGYFDLKPDLITLGKVIGGGMPVAAFGGRAEVMNTLSPEGSVYQAGTLSGNPVALAAGLATLKLIRAEGFYAQLEARARQLTEGLCNAAQQYGIPFSAQYLGGMFGMYFSELPPRNMLDMQKSNIEHFKIFFHRMLEAGYYFSPSAFEAGFISIAHSFDDIEKTIAAAKTVFFDLSVKS